MNTNIQPLPFPLYERARSSINACMPRTKSKNLGSTINQGTSSLSPNYDALLYTVGQKKDKPAFIALFEYFAPRIKSFLIKGGLSPDAADELAQETMFSVWNKASGYNPAKAKASTWIFTIARNKKIDAFRKVSREHIVDMELDLLKDSAPSPSKNTQRVQEEQLIAQALETLPSEQSELIQKSFFEGKSHSEIAKETNIPLGTIKSRIKAALERLRGQRAIKDLK